MTETGLADRAIADVLSVCRHACPVSAVRWLAALATHGPECLVTRSLDPADRIRGGTRARFRVPDGVVVELLKAYAAGTRKMYCDNTGNRVDGNSSRLNYAYFRRP